MSLTQTTSVPKTPSQFLSNKSEENKRKWIDCATKLYQDPTNLELIPDSWFGDDTFYAIIMKLEVVPPLSVDQKNHLHDEQREWIRRVKERSCRRRVAELWRQREEARLEDIMKQLWDEAEAAEKGV